MPGQVYWTDPSAAVTTRPAVWNWSGASPARGRDGREPDGRESDACEGVATAVTMPAAAAVSNVRRES